MKLILVLSWAALLCSSERINVVIWERNSYSTGVMNDAAYDLDTRGASVEFTTRIGEFIVLTIEDGDLDDISHIGGVAYAELDNLVYTQGTQFDPENWGIDRIDQFDMPLDESFTYPNSAGNGVNVYVLDTGIEERHPNFEGRATYEACFASSCDTGGDVHGHGTHVAGIAGSRDFGVAKECNLIGIQVLTSSGSGQASGIVAGIGHAVEHHQESGNNLAIINLSLGGLGNDQIYSDVIRSAREAGVITVVASGNELTDACTRQPAYVPEAITTSASDENDGFGWYSNFGSCVDIIAPGSNIKSTFKGGGTDTKTGTSMATPHVAGVLALIISEQSDSGSPNDIENILFGLCVTGRVSPPSSTTDLLLQVPESDNPSEPTPPSPPISEEELSPLPSPNSPPAPNDPNGCECTGQINTNGEGGLCRSWSLGGRFCYCTETCPDAQLSGLMQEWFYCEDCDDYPQRGSEDIQVRFADGPSLAEGRVEIFYNERWGTVCDDDFDIADAHVICKMAGFTSGAKEIRVRAFYGQGRGDIWIDQLECDGTENSILECDKNAFGDHDCSHSEDAGVVCFSVLKEEDDIDIDVAGLTTTETSSPTPSETTRSPTPATGRDCRGRRCRETE